MTSIISVNDCELGLENLRNMRGEITRLLIESNCRVYRTNGFHLLRQQDSTCIVYIHYWSLVFLYHPTCSAFMKSYSAVDIGHRTSVRSIQLSDLKSFTNKMSCASLACLGRVCNCNTHRQKLQDPPV